MSAPTGHLKQIQRQLANLLQDCWDELRGTYKRQVAHGFVSRRSILTNAHEHRGRAHVFNIDLDNFFGAINFGRVRGFFIKDKDFALDPVVATILAQIACFNNCLPQGSPASPVISNLIGNVLDTRLVKIAIKYGCIYTRYADDLTFSTNHEAFPSQLAFDHGGTWTVGAELEKIVTRSGFSVNTAKVRMQIRDSRQSVTGLVVNHKANTPASYRSTLRAMAKRLFTKGEFHYERWIKDSGGTLVKQSQSGTCEQLQGMLAHVEHVDQFNRILRKQSETTAPGRHRLYRRFFFYSQFFVK